ncbi:MAG: hypothetical protein H8F28_23265 [Fibrella sp.]|nr:hypothetical protein [Armatimonadota bacterium]
MRRLARTEQVFWGAERPEANVAVVAQPDGYLRFEVYPASGAPALKQVAPRLSRGCHWLLNIRHQSGRTRIRLAEVGYQDGRERAENPYDYDQARKLIANLFSKD